MGICNRWRTVTVERLRNVRGIMIQKLQTEKTITTMDEAVEFLSQNYDKVKAAYTDEFGDFTGMPNARVEAILGDDRILVSCHYNDFDDYNENCDDENCNGGCDICDNKSSWDFELYIDANGEISVA